MKADRTIRRGARPPGTGTLGWFSRQLLPWYLEHKRPLPWRGLKDPYPIWLSEVILQQTRVDQGMAYWHRFMERFPTVGDLARASEDEVLKLWQGLGYYSRARNLLAAAKQVVDEHGGRFPPEHRDLLQLKGVGDYTASAIASIAFNKPEAVVDGNVYRVLARFFGIATAIDSTAGRKQFKELAQALIDPKQPGDHNQALMELGAVVCAPKRPSCERCPLRAKCVALATHRIDELPVKAGVTPTRDRYFNYLRIVTPNGIYMQRREDRDIWQGLFELPLIESRKLLTKGGLMGEMGRMGGMGQKGRTEWTITGGSKEVKHVLSHQIIHAVFWEVVPPKTFKPPKTWKLIPLSKLHALAVPKLIERWLGTL